MPKTMKQVHDEVADLLASKEGQTKLDALGGVLTRLDESRDSVKEALAWIRQRTGATFYLNTTQATGGGVTVDVRIRGRKVGSVSLQARGRRVFTPYHAEFASHWSADAKTAPWEHGDVAAYLDRCIESLRTQERESAAEAALIRHMSNERADTKPEALHYTQPAFFPDRGGVPLKHPLPINGRSGDLAESWAYADVLARRGRGGHGVAVFEVKKQGANDVSHALEQAVRYAATLHHVRSHATGAVLWKLLGFERDPKTIRNFEAVAVVHASASDASLRKAADALRQETVEGYSLRGLKFEIDADGDFASLTEVNLNDEG